MGHRLDLLVGNLPWHSLSFGRPRSRPLHFFAAPDALASASLATLVERIWLRVTCLKMSMAVSSDDWLRMVLRSDPSLPRQRQAFHLKVRKAALWDLHLQHRSQLLANSLSKGSPVLAAFPLAAQIGMLTQFCPSEGLVFSICLRVPHLALKPFSNLWLQKSSADFVGDSHSTAAIVCWAASDCKASFDAETPSPVAPSTSCDGSGLVKTTPAARSSVS